MSACPGRVPCLDGAPACEPCFAAQRTREQIAELNRRIAASHAALLTCPIKDFDRHAQSVSDHREILANVLARVPS